MEQNKGKGGEYGKYPPPGKRLGESQSHKRVYCYCKWMWMSRRLRRRGEPFDGRGLPIVPGVREGYGGMGLWRRFSMVLPNLFFFGGIVVRIVN